MRTRIQVIRNDDRSNLQNFRWGHLCFEPKKSFYFCYRWDQGNSAPMNSFLSPRNVKRAFSTSFSKFHDTPYNLRWRPNVEISFEISTVKKLSGLLDSGHVLTF